MHISLFCFMSYLLCEHFWDDLDYLRFYFIFSVIDCTILFCIFRKCAFFWTAGNHSIVSLIVHAERECMTKWSFPLWNHGNLNTRRSIVNKLNCCSFAWQVRVYQSCSEGQGSNSQPKTNLSSSVTEKYTSFNNQK